MKTETLITTLIIAVAILVLLAITLHPPEKTIQTTLTTIFQPQENYKAYSINKVYALKENHLYKCNQTINETTLVIQEEQFLLKTYKCIDTNTITTTIDLFYPHNIPPCTEYEDPHAYQLCFQTIFFGYEKNNNTYIANPVMGGWTTNNTFTILYKLEPTVNIVK